MKIAISFVWISSLFMFFSCNKSQQQVKENIEQETEKVVRTSNSEEQNESASNNENANYAKFSFEENEYNFGEISEGDKVEHIFKFKNVGDAALVISDIKTSCGCTTPSYTKDPIVPGESGEIMVRFNSKGKSGIQNKKIRVFANTEKSIDIITIKAKVNKLSEGPYKNNS